MRLKKLAILLAVVLTFAGASLAFAAFNAAPTPQDILTRAAQTLQAAQDGHAVLSLQGKTTDKNVSATVEVWAKKISSNPANYKFRAEVHQASDPQAQGSVVVSDGKTFWAYSPAQKTVQTGSVAKLQDQQNQSTHLLSDSPQALVQQLLDVSTVTLVGSDTTQGHATYKLQLVPISGKTPAAVAGATALLWIDQSRWLPLQASINGGSAGQGQVTVQSVELNTGIPDSQFTFQVPQGAKVVSVDALIPQHMSLSQAAQTAGFTLKTPAFVPASAKLVDVFKTGKTFVLRYNDSAGSFSVAEGTDTQPKPSGLTSKSVALKGATGTLYTDSAGKRVLLTWTENGVTFSVSGAISSADAVQVANSLQ